MNLRSVPMAHAPAWQGGSPRDSQQHRLAVARPRSLTDTWLRDLGAETPASKGSQVGRPQHLAVGLKCLWFDLEKKQKVGSSKRQVGFV